MHHSILENENNCEGVDEKRINFTIIIIVVKKRTTKLGEMEHHMGTV